MKTPPAPPPPWKLYVPDIQSVEPNDYDIHLPQAKRTHEGSLLDAFEREMHENRAEVATNGIARNWWAYQGREVRPFVAYTRWQPDRLTIAVIAGDKANAGRMRPICAALDTLALSEGISLRFEAVFNKNLQGVLFEQGYRYSDGNPSIFPDLVKHVPAPSA